MKKKILVVMAIFALYIMSVQAQDILPTGTKIEVSLTQDVSSATPNAQVAVTVIKDIKLKKKVIIKKGTPVKIKLPLIQPATFTNTGLVDIQVISLKTIDGKEIFLNAGIYRDGLKNKFAGLGVEMMLTGIKKEENAKFLISKRNVTIKKKEVFPVYVSNEEVSTTINQLAQQQSQNQQLSADDLANAMVKAMQVNQPTQQPTNAQSPAKPERILSDVDIDIPVSNIKNSNIFALIIANEDYTFLGKVDYAQNDGETFKEYCIKTLGIPEKQVWLLKNASAGIIDGGISKMEYALNNFEGAKAIVYYCGHGIPDEKSGDAYIIPTDGKGTNVSTCRSLSDLYKTLASTKASDITYFMDACFTGANKEGSMLVAARGVAREAKKETLEGNTVVFSASSGDETAMAYPEKQHGIFTYFLLKKLQETKGDVSYEELSNYIKDNVKKEAFITNEKPQNPMVATSEDAKPIWKTMRFW